MPSFDEESESADGSLSISSPSPLLSNFKEPPPKKLKYERSSSKNSLQEGIASLSSFNKKWEEYLDMKMKLSSSCSTSSSPSVVQKAVAVLNELADSLGENYVPILRKLTSENSEILLAMLPEKRLEFLLSLK